MKPTCLARRAICAAGVLLAFAGCGGADDDTAGRPLFDEVHQDDLLVEARALETPPSTSGNRFLAGWWPFRPAGVDALLAIEGGARVELVQLAARARTVVFDLADGEPAAGTVRVRADGREIGRLPITDPLRVELPADLPLGRVLVELQPQDGARLAVRAAAARTAVAAGDAQRDGADLLQTGHSLVEVVRRVPAGAVLTGVFQPPASPPASQEFLLHVERDGESEIVFRWTGTLWNRLRGRRAFDVPLGAEAGLVRIRLEARGEGPACRWNRFRVSVPEAAAGDPAGADGERPADPPRLVVLYVMDALRADRVGFLGGPKGASPTLDRLAADGLAYLEHRSVAPNTLPSTKALLTGEAWVEGGGARLGDGPATLAEAFRAAGYATAMVSNNPFVSATYGVDRGFDLVAAPAAEPGVPFHDDATRVHAAALDWLRSLEPGQPAFLYLHTLHPHNPYDPPPPFRAAFTAGVGSTIDGSTETLLDVQRFRREADEADRRRLAGLYAGNLAYNDAELAWFLAALAEIHLPEDTFLAVTSDHGEELFDHGGVLHGWTLYEEMLRIPLVVWSPSRIAPGERRDPTDTLDLHATLLELTGAAGASEGRSLLRSLAASDGAVHFAAAASVKGGVFSAQSRRWKLVWAPRTDRGWGMGEALGRSRDAEYLFDLEADPGERVNRAGEGGLEAAWLRARLLAWVASKRAAPAAEPEVDAATRKRLEALGYVE